MTGCVLIYALTATSNPRTQDPNVSHQSCWMDIRSKKSTRQRFTRRQRLFNIVLRNLHFEAARQMLPKSGADDGMLWNILSTPLLRSTLARRLQILPDFLPFKKVRHKNIKHTMVLVSKSFQNLATDNRSKRTVS